MPVNTISADQFYGRSVNHYNAPATSHVKHRSGNKPTKKNFNKPYKGYKCRAKQLKPALDQVTDVMAADLEGCQHNGVQYTGSLSLANKDKKAVYDVFADHGRFGTLNQFINGLPPKWKQLGVDWKDLAPWNGAKPIKEVIQNFITLTTGQTVVFHSFQSDKRMLDNSAAMCGLTIPWHDITIRDTQLYRGYWLVGTNPRTGPSLADVVAVRLPWLEFPKVKEEAKNKTKGQGNNNGKALEAPHNSLEDSIATLLLYLLRRQAIDAMYAPIVPLPAANTQSEGSSSSPDSKSTVGSPNTAAIKSSATGNSIYTIDFTDNLDEAVKKLDKIVAGQSWTTLEGKTITKQAPRTLMAEVTSSAADTTRPSKSTVSAAVKASKAKFVAIPLKPKTAGVT